MRLPILITALIYNQEQRQATKECFDSLQSNEHLLDISIDSRNESISLTKKWNDFLDQWRDRDYEYLVIIANDTLARPETIDYMVRFMNDNPDVGIGESKLNRNREEFLAIPIEYSTNSLVDIDDTSNFIIRKGVIEKVGRFNENRYPFAHNERDYIYRCKLAEVSVVQTEMRLFYHPPVSLTLENRGDYDDSRKTYREQWGGEWLAERYTKPFNKEELDYTFSS